MKPTIIFYIFTLSLTFTILAYGSDYTYDVSGNSDSGHVTGEIEANSGEKDVDGYLVDENGNQIHFEGEWTGNGEIEGYDENGNYVELEVE